MLTLYTVGTTQNKQEHKEWYKYCTKQTQRKEMMSIALWWSAKNKDYLLDHESKKIDSL